MSFVVCGGRGALVREAAAADSTKVGVLPLDCACEGLECEEVDGKLRVRIAAGDLTGWVSQKLLKRTVEPIGACRVVDSPLVRLDWFGKDYSGRFATAHGQVPKKHKVAAIRLKPVLEEGTKTGLDRGDGEEPGWTSQLFPTPFLSPANWREMPGAVIEAVGLSDTHTTALVGGAETATASHPAAIVARAGPSGPAFGRFDDSDSKRTPEEQRANDQLAFPDRCASCRRSDGCRILYAAICSQHSSYSMSHYQWVVEYEIYCLRCDLAGKPPYTSRTNATSHAMPAAQGYIAREGAFRGIPK